MTSQLGAAGRDSIAFVGVHGEGVASMNLPPNSLPAGLAFDSTAANLYVAFNRRNTLARIDVGSGEVVATLPVGVAPLDVVIRPQGDRLFVTNWGGRRPEPTEPQALSAGTGTLIDDRGIASSGSVSVVDIATFSVIAEIPVGLHPSGIRISSDGRLAAVANSNSDSLTLLDTETLNVIDTIPIPAFPSGFGSSPNAVAFSASGQWLYVACGGNNAVAVLERGGSSYVSRGFAPTDWYPLALAVAGNADAQETVYVASSKGVGARNSKGPFSVFQPLGSLNIFKGGVQSTASDDVLATLNDPFRSASFPEDSPRDLRSLGLDHVFLIIKENRTYDQVLGDLGRGNGDPKLALYGQDVTPNQHALANQFAMLDNFYASGTRSADGHAWLTQSMVTAYLERGEAAFPRSFPFDGTDPLAFASSGFLWNRAQLAGLTVQLFGEFTVPAISATHTWDEFLRDSQASSRQYSERSRSPVSTLNGIIESDYPAFRLNVPDVYRARIFIEKFNSAVSQNNVPNLVVIQLPTDHTVGTTPLQPTPRTMVADNDLAVGQIVDTITHSPIWPSSVIFVTEDDAQDGVDHVDGHRTLCLVISPFARREVVDSIHYNQTSLVRTIEELLGLAPMTKFDASALPMRSVFSVQGDWRPFSVLPNRIPLNAMNPSLTALKGKQKTAARQSIAMNFSKPDAAPEERLNRILWHVARGWNARYPRVPHGPECPKDD